jgi:small subunit ribosomal protein S13e
MRDGNLAILTVCRIGEVLRDSHGIAQVKIVTGNKILRILKSHGMIACPG